MSITIKYKILVKTTLRELLTNPLYKKKSRQGSKVRKEKVDPT